MSGWQRAFVVYQVVVISYFAVLNLLFAFFAFVGLRSVIVYSRELSQVALRDLLEREVYKPVSILVPAFNEELSIVASVRSFVGLHYPKFEVIVVNDGSTDGTMDVLIDAFALVDDPHVWSRRLEYRPVSRVMRSLRHPNLVVAEKQNGGKADALNAALDLATFPLVAPVDSDSVLDAEAILRASRLFVEDEAVIAVGGTIRPLNGAVMALGRPAELRMPSRWVERLQIVEYARAFFLGRAGWTRLGALMIISGAFGLFRRDVVEGVGGFWTGTIGEDMELVMRLHREHVRSGIPHRIVFSPDPICWTEVPADLRSLRGQRNRWHRGLWTNLWRHRGMLLNPRYGRLGMIAVPYFWLFEGLGPIVEATGFVVFVVSAAFGWLDATTFWLFLMLAVFQGILQSQIAVGVEAMLLQRYPRARDRLVLLAAGFLEFTGFHQVIALERLRATMQALVHKPPSWGHMRRVGLRQES